MKILKQWWFWLIVAAVAVILYMNWSTIFPSGTTSTAPKTLTAAATTTA